MCRLSRLPTVNSARPQRVAGREEPTWHTETTQTRRSQFGTRLRRSILAAPSPGRCVAGREHASRPRSSETGIRIGRRSSASSSGRCGRSVTRRTWRGQRRTRLPRSILAVPSPGRCAQARSQAASGSSGRVGYRTRSSWTSSSRPERRPCTVDLIRCARGRGQGGSRLPTETAGVPRPRELSASRAGCRVKADPALLPTNGSVCSRTRLVRLARVLGPRRLQAADWHRGGTRPAPLGAGLGGCRRGAIRPRRAPSGARAGAMPACEARASRWSAVSGTASGQRDGWPH